jgi:hypothetical protein
MDASAVLMNFVTDNYMLPPSSPVECASPNLSSTASDAQQEDDPQGVDGASEDKPVPDPPVPLPMVLKDQLDALQDIPTGDFRMFFNPKQVRSYRCSVISTARAQGCMCNFFSFFHPFHLRPGSV